MLHQSAVQNIKDFAIAYKMKVGVWMFLLYALFYGGFVILNVLQPVRMGEPFWLGMNLAVVFGFGLIIFALVLAVIYNGMCNRKEKALNPPVVEGEKKK
jgi:uncharacterized membrane protein (DUF485 family)